MGKIIPQESREAIIEMNRNGLSDNNIAAALGISSKTVAAYLVGMGIERKMRRAPDYKPEVNYVSAEDMGIDENWETQGLCRTGRYDPDLWFPHPTEGSIMKLAQKVCYRCPVIMECRTTALARGEKNGIWGGLTESQRRQMRNGNRYQEEEREIVSANSY